jgi:hypothetical protein
MPMTKWSGRSKGMISFEQNQFTPNLQIEKEDEEILFKWM